ncbi:hypothetical protein [Streptomyces sp. B15]|uniref:hypothetical protein n=1 Tax=Streptomyces sp. B15 TaxID=1537797 RepID=UPI001B35B7EB|nr:hypothetical protein [Streptomyces sp. B15]MBQ1124191.1 hypothetical protein [Streptomyces sp. B15]
MAGSTHAEIHDSRSPLWEPDSVNRGYPALGLLHAELGRSVTDRQAPDRDCDLHRATAHRYLELTAAATRELPVRGAFAGVGSPAAPARVAAAHEAEYASLLRRRTQADEAALRTALTSLVGHPAPAQLIDTGFRVRLGAVKKTSLRGVCRTGG